MRYTDFEQLNPYLLDALWHVSAIFVDIDDEHDLWGGLLESVFNKHAPLSRKRVHKKDLQLTVNLLTFTNG